MIVVKNSRTARGCLHGNSHAASTSVASIPMQTTWTPAIGIEKLQHGLPPAANWRRCASCLQGLLSRGGWMSFAPPGGAAKNAGSRR
jgi:hypothetical protein